MQCGSNQDQPRCKASGHALMFQAGCERAKRVTRTDRAAAAAEAAAVGDGASASAEWELCDVQPLQPIPERRHADVRPTGPKPKAALGAVSTRGCSAPACVGVGRRSSPTGRHERTCKARVRECAPLRS